jgi:hypothetical protein
VEELAEAERASGKFVAIHLEITYYGIIGVK